LRLKGLYCDKTSLVLMNLKMNFFMHDLANK